MSDALWKRLQLLLSVLSVLLLLALLAAAAGWWWLRGSLPPLDGSFQVPGLSAAAKIERDGLGVPTITGATREDVARATGFAHAQDRFFQMDLLRRSGAGELAEIFGPAAVPLDQAHRLHGFRRNAAKILATLPPPHRQLLEAYAEGVNAGLASLARVPWEYTVLRTTPRPWQAVDCLLAAYAMWFDLYESNGRREQSLQALREAVGQAGVDFLAPRGNSWDSPLDDSQFPAPPLPTLRLRPAGEAPAQPALVTGEPRPVGSNSFALAPAHTADGAALLASDMHLDLAVPPVWYRAVLRWTDGAGAARQLAGVTLPGLPLLLAGSNGHVAWGFTVSYVDTSDVVVIEADATAQLFYRTPQGYAEIEDRAEPIQVKGQAAVPFTARWTKWGPVIGANRDGRLLALRWTAHDPDALNLDLLGLETAATAEEAARIGRGAGMPSLNLLAVDRAGGLAWTITGRLPKRVGYDGRFPVSWSYGDRRWDGWLPAEDLPLISNPASGLLWTANQRLVGGAAYAKLGDGGYHSGARGAQIRDTLRELAASGRKAAATDLLALQLDDRALFLARWQRFLLKVLTDDAVAAKSSRAELRAAVRQWNGRASTDSAAYRLVRAWRLRVASHVLAPFVEKARASYPAFESNGLLFEDAVWRLAHERPAHLLNPAHASWEALLLAAADEVVAEADKAGVAPAHWTWGAHNTLRMQHPFSRFLPRLLGRFLDMPAQPLPGGSDMPRMQTPNFGASQRFVVAPGREAQGFFHMPGGQSGHPLSPYYRAGHDAWVQGAPTPFLPGPARHTLSLQPQ